MCDYGRLDHMGEDNPFYPDDTIVWEDPEWSDITVGLSGKRLVEVIAINLKISKAETKRLLKGVAVSYRDPDGTWWWPVDVSDGVPLNGCTVKVGKHRFLKMPVMTHQLLIQRGAVAER